MFRCDFRTACLNCNVPANRRFRRVFQIDADDSDRTIDNTAGAGNGVRVRIVTPRIGRLIHGGFRSELIRRRECCAVLYFDARSVFGLDFRYRHANAANADTRRGGESLDVRGVVCRERNRLAGELRVLADFRLYVDRRLKFCTRPRAAENTGRRANRRRIHLRLCARSDHEGVICLHFARIDALVIANSRL